MPWLGGDALPPLRIRASSPSQLHHQAARQRRYKKSPLTAPPGCYGLPPHLQCDAARRSRGTSTLTKVVKCHKHAQGGSRGFCCRARTLHGREHILREGSVLHSHPADRTPGCNALAAQHHNMTNLCPNTHHKQHAHMRIARTASIMHIATCYHNRLHPMFIDPSASTTELLRQPVNPQRDLLSPPERGAAVGDALVGVPPRPLKPSPRLRRLCAAPAAHERLRQA